MLWLSFTFLDSDLHKNALLQVIRQFSEMGHKPELIALRSRNMFQDKGLQERIIAVPIRYVPFLSTFFFMIIETIVLPFYILISKPDFIIYEPDVHILSSFSALIISKFNKVRLILDIRTVPVETAGLRGFLRKFWFSISVLIAKHFFDGETIITHPMKKQVSIDYDLDSKKIGVWTSGVSESLFKPLPEAGLALRSKYGLNDRFVVFYHGVFTPSRALKETIEAMNIIATKYPDIVLFLLGSGPSLPLLKETIEVGKLEKFVIIKDPVDQKEVPKFISFCNVGIIPLPDHPYWRFQSPLKLLEYLAMEKVTILTDITAHRSVISEEKCGIYISSVAPSEIALAIEYAYLHSSSLEEWGKVGRKIVLEEYTWKKVAEDLQAYLFSI